MPLVKANGYSLVMKCRVCISSRGRSGGAPKNVAAVRPAASDRPIGNAVTHWNAVATDAFTPSEGTNPVAQSRTLAVLHAAMHDALNAIDRRFEAYTPAPKRKLGYYALPLLWRDRVIGWSNVSVKDGELRSEQGFVGSRPRDPAFRRGLEAELERMRVFLRLGKSSR